MAFKDRNKPGPTARRANRRWATVVGVCALLAATSMIVDASVDVSPLVEYVAIVVTFVSVFAAILTTVMRARAAGDPDATSGPR